MSLADNAKEYLEKARKEDWIVAAFYEIMNNPNINDISPEQEALMGWKAYCALATAMAAVMDYRLTLAWNPPTPNHCNWCTNHTLCRLEWEKGWTSIPGVLGALLKDELAGLEIHDNLEMYPVGAMNVECHRRTCEGLKQTSERKSILRVEESITDQAIQELMRQLGIV
ncbi:hypothetical protein B0H13DRAFT_2313105 [Mycena leptocephala]|nr:hypothetical protein B0H13DRAFT_2313105 [Mycena leptocephala]